MLTLARTQLHDEAWFYRHLFFFVTPLVLWFLPYTYLPRSPFRLLPPTSLAMDRLMNHLTLASLVAASSQLDSTLRSDTYEHWAAKEDEMNIALEDKQMQAEAETAGLGFSSGEGEAGPVRKEARKIADGMVEVGVQPGLRLL